MPALCFKSADQRWFWRSWPAAAPASSRIAHSLNGKAGIAFLDELVAALGDLNDPVAGDVLERLHRPRTRPAYAHLIDRLMAVQTEVQPQRTLRTVAVAQHHFPRLHGPVDMNDHPRPHGVLVRYRSDQFDLQPVPAFAAAGFILRQAIADRGGPPPGTP